MDAIRDFLGQSILNITVGQLLGAFLAVLVGFVGRHVIRFVLERAKRVTARSRTRLDDIFIDALRMPAGWASILAGIWVATQILPLPVEPVNIRMFIGALAKGTSMLLLVWFAIRLTDRVCIYWSEQAQLTNSKLDDQAIPIIQGTSKVFLVLVGGALFLQNLGYSVGSLIAGLGLGGAALALASKDTLSNLFGAIVIFWDRPFEVGDWVDLEGVEGTVEEVGLRTTRIRTFANSLVTLPNMKLTTASINNWSKMQKRRIKMTIGVTYDSSPGRMEAGVKAIQDIIGNSPDFHHDFYLVRFNAFGPSSLDIFVYCFTVTTVWAEFLEVQEQFLLEIMRRFEALELSFAFPTQTLHVASLPDGKASEK